MVGGFISVSGRTVTVGAASLAKARQLMAECADASQEKEAQQPQQGGSRADVGHSPPPAGVSRGEDTAEDNRAPPPASGFGGFTTAGGRKLEVSKEALHRASRLLNDNDDESTAAAAAGSPPDTARDEAMDLVRPPPWCRLSFPRAFFFFFFFTI
jgi:hypothetical protein